MNFQDDSEGASQNESGTSVYTGQPDQDNAVRISPKKKMKTDGKLKLSEHTGRIFR